MIKISPSTTADTRTCDFQKVTKDQLIDSSRQHINDVRKGLDFFERALDHAKAVHDYDKIQDIETFHKDFVTGFAQTIWWDRHRRLNRHHLNTDDGIPDDVNLIDVLDYIADCVMASVGRESNFPITLPAELLARAFTHTVTLLKNEVILVKE